MYGISRIFKRGVVKIRSVEKEESFFLGGQT